MTAAHAEFRRVLVGLLYRQLPYDVLSTLHAARRVADAAEPLPVALDAALRRAATWGDVAGILARWSSGEEGELS